MPVLRRRNAPQYLQVPAVHGEDQLEGLEIVRRYLARAQPAEIVAAAPRVLLRALIRRLADVVVVRPGRIDADLVGQARLTHQPPHDAVGGRRAADVAGADEENAAHRYSDASATPNTCFFSSASWSRIFAACSNSRFFACSSIFFSSCLISRAICFSLIAS